MSFEVGMVLGDGSTREQSSAVCQHPMAQDPNSSLGKPCTQAVPSEVSLLHWYVLASATSPSLKQKPGSANPKLQPVLADTSSSVTKDQRNS